MPLPFQQFVNNLQWDFKLMDFNMPVSPSNGLISLLTQLGFHRSHGSLEAELERGWAFLAQSL